MNTDLDQNENRSVLFLALIFACRMLGLFMVLPILSVTGDHMPDARPSLIGLALGAYGLTQAFCQIPFSMLSDRVGRKPVIAMGLILFFLGSVLAANASSMYGIILGRAIQGAGAIGSVILALLSDVTRMEHRTRAMAIIGLSIGFSFVLAMVSGPALYSFFSLKGLFWTMAVLALLGLFILQFVAQGHRGRMFHPQTVPSWSVFKQLVSMPELMRLNTGIFIQHAILTASFIVVPSVLSQSLNLPRTHDGLFYLFVLSLAALATFPLIRFSEQRRFVRGTVLCAISVLSITQIFLAIEHTSWIWATTVLSIFFLAFTLLEAFLPSLISKLAPIQNKGTAMGIYSTCQFLGIFVGGSLSGLVLSQFGLNGVFLFCAILGILWLVVAIPMQSPDETNETRTQSVINQFNVEQGNGNERC